MSRDESYSQTPENVRADMPDDVPKDKSNFDVALFNIDDLIESLHSTAMRLERNLKPVLRQAAPSNPDATVRDSGTKASISDGSAPMLQRISSQGNRLTDVLVHLNNLNDALEI